MKTTDPRRAGWVAYAALTVLFIGSYSAIGFGHRSDLGDTTSAGIGDWIAIVLLADWVMALLFSVVTAMRGWRVGVAGLLTTVLFLLMLVMPAVS